MRKKAEPESTPATAPVEDLSETVPALSEPGSNGSPIENGTAGAMLPHAEGESLSTNVWNDEAAESAFRAEARDRGESVAVPRPDVEEGVAEAKDLPPLDELVKRLSPDVRDVLDDLFRAKFTTVRRVPVKALKT